MLRNCSAAAGPLFNPRYASPRRYAGQNSAAGAWSYVLTGSSNAIVRFRHPNGHSSRLDRYNWFISHGPEARSVTSRLARQKVLDALSDVDLMRLFKRSMPISRPDPLAGRR